MKRVPPAATRFSAMPLTMASMRPRTTSVACTRPTIAPHMTPARTPANELWVASATETDASDDASSVPSRAMFTTPLRSLSTPPSAAHTYGIVMRAVWASMVPETMTSSAPIVTCLPRVGARA